MKYIPPSFDAARVAEGLHRAMGFGEPTRAEDKVTFYFNARSHRDESTDEDGVPFDPDQRPTRSTTSKVVPCVVEYQDRAAKVETFGTVVPARVLVTLIDEDYQEIKAFTHLKAGGDVYWRSTIEPPIALGSIDVWTLICLAEGES